jgi:hypothetical protein
MAVFTKIDGFVKQVAIFIRNNDYGRAYEASREMEAAFPGDMMSHYLISKSAFLKGDYEESAAEGTKAFNIARERQDLLSCALQVAAAKFMLGKYDEGYRLLMIFGSDGNEHVEQMLLIFSSVLGNEEATEKHARALMRHNREAGTELLSRFLSDGAAGP